MAALKALVLLHELAEGRADLALRFFDRAKSVVDVAWNMAVGDVVRFPRPTDDQLT